ncbi:MAG: hypothetical protein CMN79_05015 [Spirochaetales bacterium]|jgi:acyl carrier protein|nr:hypothetical protein [Spirochaetales bacterium]|tara:strand:- start:2469 stop:2723 length:255 start_codon:yes stop_codon:yes gene_type:complete
MEKIIKKIIKILNKKKLIILKENQLIEKYNFINNGHIDSLGLIKFVFEIEKEFKINLSDKNIESKNFGNVLGLAKIINSKIKKN